MKKDRILSLILSVMMMFTIIFPTGVFAEEIDTQEYEPEVEEVVVEIGNDDEVVPQQGTEQDEEPAADPVVEVQDEEPVVPAEETQDDEPAAPAGETQDEESTTPADETQDDEPAVPSEETQDDEPAAETEVAVEEEVVASEIVDDESVTEEAALAAVEEEEQPFVQGYVRVNGGTIVYAAESKQEENGSFSGDAIVYATVSTRASEEAYTWLRIVFDTAEAKEANEALLSGYVQFKDVNVLSDEAVEQLTESLKNDTTVRSHSGNPIPLSIFIKRIVEQDESVDVVVNEVFSASAISIVSIKKDPEDVMVSAGETVTFTVEASGNGLSYRWQALSSATAEWKNTTLSGYKTATLTVTATAARNGYQYRCVVTDENGKTATSNPATLIISKQLVIESVTYEAITSTTCRVVSYSGSASSLVIPETVEGMTVTETGVEAFMGNKNLVSIDLPDTITVIKARAFKGCSNLSDMH